MWAHKRTECKKRRISYLLANLCLSSPGKGILVFGHPGSLRDFRPHQHSKSHVISWRPTKPWLGTLHARCSSIKMWNESWGARSTHTKILWLAESKASPYLHPEQAGWASCTGFVLSQAAVLREWWSATPASFIYPKRHSRPHSSLPGGRHHHIPSMLLEEQWHSIGKEEKQPSSIHK